MRISLLSLSITLLAAGCEPAASNNGSRRGAGANSAQPARDSNVVPGDGVRAGRETPVDLKLLDYEGILRLVASHRGKVVVMDAWSTACDPCVKEFPHLVALHNKVGPQRLACISLSLDYEGIGQPEEQRAKVLDFLRRQGASFDNILASEESDAIYRKFKLAAVPAVFVYDRQGNLRKRFDNERARSKSEMFTYQQVGELVEQLLKEQ